MAQALRHWLRKYVAMLSIALGVILVVGGVFFIQSRFNVIPSIVHSSSLPATTVPFPDVLSTDMNDTQKEILTILRDEYQAQPSGTKYAEGIEEPWCADFVSWVMKEAGIPLENPHSGSWRIPGTYTLREYYEKHDRFQSASSTYEPKVGDIVLYDNPSTFGQHTNFVLSTEEERVTTIGGNEGGKIRIQTHDLKNDPGFLGYGVLGK